MATWTLGNATVTRLEEQLGYASLPPEKFLDGFDRELLAQHLDWLVPPVLNAHTRLAVEMNAGLETLLVQGWHGREARTHVLRLGPGLP